MISTSDLLFQVVPGSAKENCRSDWSRMQLDHTLGSFVSSSKPFPSPALRTYIYRTKIFSSKNIFISAQRPLHNKAVFSCRLEQTKVLAVFGSAFFSHHYHPPQNISSCFCFQNKKKVQTGWNEPQARLLFIRYLISFPCTRFPKKLDWSKEQCDEWTHFSRSCCTSAICNHTRSWSKRLPNWISPYYAQEYST